MSTTCTYVVRTCATVGPRGGKVRECFVVLADTPEGAGVIAGLQSANPSTAKIIECTRVTTWARVSVS